jgi:hypothetical protein
MANRLIREQKDILTQTQALRAQMMSLLSDKDLTFRLPGNPTLGELCQQSGEIEHSYIQSFKTFTQDFSYRSDDSALATSLPRLQMWLTELDEELLATLEALSDDDIEHKFIARPGGFNVPITVQVHIYREALLIFYGRADVYLKALSKTPGEQWQAWIG